MAQFDFTATIPLSKRLALYAEDLDAEGATGMAEAVRDSLLEYQRAMAEGRTFDALSEATAVVGTSSPAGAQTRIPWGGVRPAR